MNWHGQKAVEISNKTQWGNLARAKGGLNEMTASASVCLDTCTCVWNWGCLRHSDKNNGFPCNLLKNCSKYARKMRECKISNALSTIALQLRKILQIMQNVQLAPLSDSWSSTKTPSLEILTKHMTRGMTFWDSLRRVARHLQPLPQRNDLSQNVVLHVIHAVVGLRLGTIGQDLNCPKQVAHQKLRLKRFPPCYCGMESNGFEKSRLEQKHLKHPLNVGWAELCLQPLWTNFHPKPQGKH